MEEEHILLRLVGSTWSAAFSVPSISFVHAPLV